MATDGSLECGTLEPNSSMTYHTGTGCTGESGVVRSGMVQYGP